MCLHVIIEGYVHIKTDYKCQIIYKVAKTELNKSKYRQSWEQTMTM